MAACRPETVVDEMVAKLLAEGGELNGDRNRLQIGPELAEKVLRAYLDIYHAAAADKLTEALEQIPAGFHPAAERIIENWKAEHDSQNTVGRRDALIPALSGGGHAGDSNRPRPPPMGREQLSLFRHESDEERADRDPFRRAAPHKGVVLTAPDKTAGVHGTKAAAETWRLTGSSREGISYAWNHH